MFDVPNLDGLSVDPADLDKAAKVFKLLRKYAKCKAAAMRQRLIGNINEALRHEHNCEVVYNDLPEWARW